MTGFSIAEVFTESLRFVARQLRALAVLAVAPYGLLLAALILIDLATADVTAQFMADWAALQDYMMQVEPGTGRPEATVTPMQVEPGTSPQAVVTPWRVILPSGQTLDFGPALLAMLVNFLALAIVPMPFRVAWLRYSLLGPRAEPVRIGYAFGPRAFRFLGYTLGLMLIMTAIMFGFAAVGGALGGGMAVLFTIGGFGVSIWVAARLYFVFPIVAMDLPGGLRRAWRESRGQAFRLLVLTLLIALVFLLPSIVVNLVLGQVPVVGAAAILLMQILTEAALWTALGFAYWKTTGIPGAGARTAQAAS